jgi:hypothetical protein
LQEKNGKVCPVMDFPSGSSRKVTSQHPFTLESQPPLWENRPVITDPDNPISIAGNLSLVIAVTVRGEPGTSDSMGITLWKGSDPWFSGRWIKTRTEEELLDGGNVVIRYAQDPYESFPPCRRRYVRGHRPP